MDAPTNSLKTECLWQCECVMGKTISAYILQKYNLDTGQLKQRSPKLTNSVITKYSNKLKQFIECQLKKNYMKIRD